MFGLCSCLPMMRLNVGWWFLMMIQLGYACFYRVWQEVATFFGYTFVCQLCWQCIRHHWDNNVATEPILKPRMPLSWRDLSQPCPVSGSSFLVRRPSTEWYSFLSCCSGFISCITILEYQGYQLLPNHLNQLNHPSFFPNQTNEYITRSLCSTHPQINQHQLQATQQQERFKMSTTFETFWSAGPRFENARVIPVRHCWWCWWLLVGKVDQWW